MKSNSKKRCGYGLMEVIISMSIIGIISIGVYNSFILSIKHTKAGQVKQEAALEGKKVIEEIKSTDIELPVNPNQTKSIGPIMITKIGSTDVYNSKIYLDENFQPIDETLAKYTEIVTMTPTQAKTVTNSDAGEVSLDNRPQVYNANDVNWKINTGREQSNGSIKDYIYDESIDVNGNEVNKSEKEIIDSQDKIILSVYLENGQNSSSRTLKIYNYNGNKLDNLDKIASLGNNGIINISFNFSNYKKIDNSNLKDVIINFYNKTADVPNIYMEKSNAVSANINILKGKMSLYNNRAENKEEARIGTLYDIKIEVRDYLENKNYELSQDPTKIWDDKDNLFTANYKQNIG